MARTLSYATQKKYCNFIRSNCAVPWSDRLELALKKPGEMVRVLMLESSS